MPMTPKGPGPIRPQVPQSAPGPQQQMTPMGPGRQMIATPIGFNMRQQTPMMQQQMQQQQSGLIHRPVGMMPQQTMPYRRTPYPIINHNQKGMLEKMVDYLVGDGANSRFAMICKECLMHNGEFTLTRPFEQLFYTSITFQEWPSRRSTSTRRSGAPSAVRSTRPKSNARWPLGFRSSRLSWTRCCGRSAGQPPPPQTRNRRPPPRTAIVPKPMQVRTTLTCLNKLQTQPISHTKPSSLNPGGRHRTSSRRSATGCRRSGAGPAARRLHRRQRSPGERNHHRRRRKSRLNRSDLANARATQEKES